MTFTVTEFITALTQFRQLFGDRTFWSYTPKQRALAVSGFTFTYLNTEPDASYTLEQLAIAYETHINEYQERERLMHKLGLTTI